MKTTAIAPASIAIIKYWGRKDEALRLPENGSIAINLDNLLTTTTVEFSPDRTSDEITIDGKSDEKEANRVIKHLDHIRALAGIQSRAKVVSKNSFPSGTGLSSSSSGFAALTVAGAKAAGLDLDQKALSILARQGSGSACRSIPDGFVEWLDGDTSDTSFALSLHPPEHWDIADIVAVVSTEKKDVSSSEGHQTAGSSLFFQARMARIKQKIQTLKDILARKDFQAFGELMEAEALEFHAVTMTSDPPLFYLLPGSVRVMRAVRRWRSEGLSVYFNLNTGQDVHVMCEAKHIDAVVAKLRELDGMHDIIVNRPGRGARLSDQHLF